MFANTLQTLMLCARRPVIWLLASALLAYGHSSAMVQLLGPAHRHESVLSLASPSWLARADAMFRDVRAWRAELRQRLLPGQHAHLHADGERHSHMHQHAEAAVGADRSGASHALAHATYQRHHHDAHDATIISLDGPGATSASDAASTAGAGSATLPLALAPRWALPMMADLGPVWPDNAPARWTDAAVSPLEHPPRV
jgi:hypothetical protein